jgi:hypothetical protein
LHCYKLLSRSFLHPALIPPMPPTNSPSAELVTVVIALVDRVKTDSKCQVHAATRLLEDAGIDSLRLMELIVALIQERRPT